MEIILYYSNFAEITNYVISNNVTGKIINKVNNTESALYYKNGLLHNEDGPAFESSYGDKYWFKDGLVHRRNGSAIEYNDGSKIWCQNGKYHRIDGPAIEYYTGAKEWWYRGIDVERKLNIRIKSIEHYKSLIPKLELLLSLE